MPYNIQRRGNAYCVVPDDAGETIHCHATEQDAQDHLQALEANVMHDDKRFAFGNAVKMTEPGIVEGYLVRFTNSSEPDFHGEYFTKNTNFYFDTYPVTGSPALYNHGLDETISVRGVGEIINVKVDDNGIYARAKLDPEKWGQEQRKASESYLEEIKRLIEEGRLGWSSGALPQSVKVADDGHITDWGIIEGSLTTAPAGGLHNTQIYTAKGLSNILTPRERSHVKEADNNDNQTEQPTTKEQLKMDMDKIREMLSDIMEMLGDDASRMMDEDEELKGQYEEEDMQKASEEVTEKAVNLVKQAAEVQEELGSDIDYEKLAKAVIKRNEGDLLQTYAEKALRAAKERRKAQKAAISAAKRSLQADEPPVSKSASVGNVRSESSTSNIQVRTPYERAGWKSEDYSFAAMLANAGDERANSTKTLQQAVNAPEFSRAFADHTLKQFNAGHIVLDTHAVKQLNAMKADEIMYSTLDGFGDQFVPTVWADNIWEKPRLDNVVPNILQQIEMPSNPYEYPVESTDPSVFFVAEAADAASLSLDASSPAMPDTQIASDKVTFTAKKLGMNIFISAELEEDGIARLIPAYRAQAERALQDARDYVAINGDTATSNNINLDGGTPGATSKYLAYDGLIHQGLVTNSATAVDANGSSPSLSLIRQLRAQLSSDIGPNPRDLALIMDTSTYISLLNDDAILTLDKYGNNATVIQGEVGSIDGIPVFPSAQIPLADTDGKVTDGGNVTDTGRLLLMHRPSWLVGYRRRISQHLQFLPHYDVHVLSMTMRNVLVGRTYSDGTQQADGTVACLYNIGI